MKRFPLIGISGSIDADESKQVLVRDYMRAVIAAGAIPLLLSLDMGEQMLGECLDQMDGLLLAGGNDIAPKLFGQLPVEALGEVNPLRDQFEVMLVREAIKRQLPTLGICRGIQAMNAALGGTLYQDLPSQYAQLDHSPCHKHAQTCGAQYASHSVMAMPNSLLFAVMGADEFEVNSFHHQAVWEVAPGMRSCARAVDGVIEAIEHVSLPFFLGVQWHPERMFSTDKQAAKLFFALSEAATAYAKRHCKVKMKGKAEENIAMLQATSGNSLF
ncbi:MAG: gamma-glutamyl-gamma-aminobutyrate hydrolase family protein [Clostridiales bacterium]|nr:gamma-glutamyl-gamma-aminobutyrate hydrolase family protein [Clostridiales bacterium]